MAKETVDSASDNPKNPKSWFVYVVLCKDGSYYCGITTDLTRRIEEHNNGTGARYTRAKRPVKLLKHWTYPDRSSASKAEYRFKQLRRTAKERLIRSD